jgi:hypothetical protein
MCTVFYPCGVYASKPEYSSRHHSVYNLIILNSFILHLRTPNPRQFIRYIPQFKVWFCVLGAFAYSRKAAVGFGMYFYPSVCMYRRDFHWKDFREILCWRRLRKSVEKLHMRLKSVKNSGHFTRRREYVSLLPATCVYHESIFMQNSIFLMVDSDVYRNSTHRTHCCVSIATMVTRTRHSVTSYVLDCGFSWRW